MYPATTRVPAGGRAQGRPSAVAGTAPPAETLDEHVADLDAHVAALAALIERSRDGIDDPQLARRAADFNAALAEEAETQRETNAVLALWTEQRKRDDEITNETIKMI